MAIPTQTELVTYPQEAPLKSIRIKGVVNGFVNGAVSANPSPPIAPASLLVKFIEAHKELASYKYVHFSSTQGASRLMISIRHGKPVIIDGHNLSIPAVTAAARFNASVHLTGSLVTRQNVKRSRAVIDNKIASGISVYGVSTGFGGSGR
jgi:phenylalanine ammonia-lyase